jgi:hypothetical protein
MKASNELTTMEHIYSDKIKEEKRKLIGQEWEFLRNNQCSTYPTDERAKTDEKGKKKSNVKKWRI